MKNWKLLLLIPGLLLILAALVLYIGQVTSCYPPASAWQQFTSDQLNSFVKTCRLAASATSRFADFLTLFVPGITLFTIYWLRGKPKNLTKRRNLLAIFLVLMMVESLLLALFGLLEVPVPGILPAAPIWSVETIAVLGLLCYSGLLGLWYWKPWGGMLYQGAAVALAAFFLLSNASRFLAAALVLSVIILAFLIRPYRRKMQ
jgi:hypothetical protein